VIAKERNKKNRQSKNNKISRRDKVKNIGISRMTVHKYWKGDILLKKAREFISKISK
jgi:hypothetical protein